MITSSRLAPHLQAFGHIHDILGQGLAVKALPSPAPVVC